jgi:hypothetical protein
VAYLILLNNAFKVALIALIVNIIASIVVEIVVEVEAMVARNLEFCSYASTITCYVVIYRVGVLFVVEHHGWRIERVV